MQEKKVQCLGRLGGAADGGEEEVEELFAELRVGVPEEAEARAGAAMAAVAGGEGGEVEAEEEAVGVHRPLQLPLPLLLPLHRHRPASILLLFFFSFRSVVVPSNPFFSSFNKLNQNQIRALYLFPISQQQKYNIGFIFFFFFRWAKIKGPRCGAHREFGFEIALRGMRRIPP